jgi:hypothetical protein
MAEPMRVKPQTDMLAPKRRNVLKDRDDPKCTKSRTDNDAPKRDMP